MKKQGQTVGTNSGEAATGYMVSAPDYEGHSEHAHPRDHLADAILHAAQAVEKAEHLIKAEILKAAERGDTNRIKSVVGRWMQGPVSKVLDPDPNEAATMHAESENLPGEVPDSVDGGDLAR